MIRGLARPLLGIAFVSTGVEALRDTDRRAERAKSYGVSQPAQASRAVAGVQIVAGLLLTLDKAPRVAALALAATVIPDAATGHAFWAESGSSDKASERGLFLRDLGLLGGVLFALDDTGGRESVPHRAVRVGRQSRKAAKAAAKSAQQQASSAAGKIG